MGNPEFAVPSLKKLAASNHEILSVVTNPPKPAGRGRKLINTPVAKCAEDLDLNVKEIDNLHSEETIQNLQKLNADVFTVVAYRILPKEIIAIPAMGSINLHGSLLPKYRGAAPIQWSLINGDSETGLTTFILQHQVDTGNILQQKKIAIDQDDNYGSLAEKMSNAGAELLVETMDEFEKGNLNPYAQDDVKATTARKISAEMTIINWQNSAQEIHNLIRGLTPSPGVRTLLSGKVLKIFETEFIKENSVLEKGEISIIEKDYFSIQTGAGQLIVSQVQLEGKRRMSAGDFLRGVQLDVGTCLG
jgi:methionyl-tRNA formyltransferase